MALFKRVPLSSIFVGERARAIDEEHAQAIAASMAERGLINPITVRPTPAKNKGSTPLTLVAGGHRWRGAQINEWTEIDVIEVEADAAEAQLLEISENLYRNELSALDRAIFVMKFREVWEDKNGKIARGGDRKSNPHDAGWVGKARSKCHDDTLIFAPGKELSERVKERLGFGERTYMRITAIGQKLHPALRSALRGSPAENDQSKLLRLCKLPADDQFRIAAALREHPDLDLALSFLKAPKSEVDPQEKLLERLCRDWDKADEQTRGAFLAHIGIDPIEYSDVIGRENADEA